MTSFQNTSANYPLEPFFNDTNDLFCIAGFDGYFKKVNPAVCKLLGFSEEELYARSIKTFIHPSDQEHTWAYRKNLINGTGFKNYENRYLTKDGETVWLSWTSIPIDSHNVVYAIAKDITKAKEREHERNTVIEKLSKINKELKDISYTTSHDLRTPVNNIMAVFSLLDTKNIKDEETREFLSILKDATDSLKDTLNEYVDNLKEKDLGSANIPPLSIENTINEVLNSMKALISETGTSVKILIPSNAYIPFSKTKLKSIFLNLLTNSIKYSHPDRSPEISITAFEEESSFLVEFKDNGIGFDTLANADKIFGLNQKFHDHEDSKGVGLYLVRNHIESMGGSINVESKLNEGTTFTLLFQK